jgi:hypothetical protein
MLLEIGEGDKAQRWHIHIHHEVLEDDSALPRKKRRSWDVVTRALVHTGVCVVGTSEPKHCVTGLKGEALCSKKDNFVKAVASRLALTRALQQMPREAREAIWEAYWLRVRRPKERSDKFQRRVGISKPIDPLIRSLTATTISPGSNHAQPSI